MPHFVDAELSVFADMPARIQKLDRLFAYMAGCSDGERRASPVFRLHTHA